MHIPNHPGKQVGPSRYMEIGLHVLVAALLAVSIIGIAYVYGFSLNGNLLDNISAAVRAVGVDGGFFLGLYFSRRHWTREKQGWGDGLKAILAGVPWFAVAMIMAGVSWLSNTIFVSGTLTIITQDALNKAGISIIDAKQANWLIGGIPLFVVLLYSLVPSRIQTHVETRSPEEIEAEAKRETARIRAQNMVAAARAEGAGARIRTVVGGLVGEAFNREEAKKREEARKRMRIALETAGHDTSTMNDEQVEIQVVSRGLWDQKKGEAIKQKPAARTTGATLRLSDVEEEEETDDADDQEGETEASANASGPQVSWLDATAVAAFLEVTKPTAVKWMRGDWNGPYRIPGCRNFETKRGRVRKAPLKSVSDVKKLLDAVRHSKNGSTPSAVTQALEQLN